MTALAVNVTRKAEVDGFRQLTDNYGSATLDPAAVVYQGALMAYDTSDDLIKPAVTSTTLICLGVSDSYIEAGEAKHPRILSGTRPFANSAAADEIANNDVGADCYAVDDNTVALTNGGATRSKAGKIIRVDADGVWVATNPYV